MKLPHLLLTACLLPHLCWAQAVSKMQNPELLRSQATQFLSSQPGTPADARIKVQPFDPQLQLPHCPAPEFSIPNPPPVLRGALRLNARCSLPQAWTIYLSASITEARPYYTTQARLEAGHILTPEDLAPKRAYPEEFPAGAVSDPQQLIGRSLQQGLEAGAVLRASLLRTSFVVTIGQTVKLVASGPGFSISTEGRAMGNAASGQRVQVRNSSGQIVQGVAQPGGIVNVSP